MGASRQQRCTAVSGTQSQRSHWVLLGAVILLLLPAVHAATGGPSIITNQQLLQEEQEWSCDAISKVPPEQQCSFVRDKCPSESLVPYAEWYFCHVAPYHVLLRSWYLLAVCCLLPLAFCLLGDTAEFYIAPIMAHVSQAIPKMRPRFAGVTFVALGNGAPDLSANIAAISAGEVVLSAGAFTGAAMFVQCVVAAELIALAGEHGIKCGGAMLRDVGVYCLAILSVLLAFSLGQISRAFVGWAIALYILYMIWVFAGDEWHHRGRPKPQLDSQSFKALLNRIASRGALAQPAAGSHPRRNSGGGSSRAVGAAAMRYGSSSREDLEESLLPWVVAEDEEVADAFDDRCNDHLGLRSNSAPRMDGHHHHQQPPEFEAPLPSPASPSPTGGGVGGPGGSGSVGPWGVRPASTSQDAQQQQQQRSTEMSAAAAGAFKSQPGFSPTDRQQGGSSRRASAPSFAGATATATSSSSGGGSNAGPPSASAAAPVSVHRFASASLPVTPPLGNPLQQQQRQGSNSFTSGNWSVRQQQLFGSSNISSGRQAPHVAQPHVVSLGRQGFIDPKTYKQLVWADLADDEEEEARLEREIARQLLVGAGRSRAPAGPPAAGSYQPPAISSAAASPSHVAEHQQQPLSPVSAATPRTSAEATQQQQLQQSQGAAEDGAFLSPFGSDAFRTGPNTPQSAEALQAAGLEAPGGHRQAGKGPLQGWPPAGLAGAVQQQQQHGQHAGAAGGLQQQTQLHEHMAEGEAGNAGDTWQQLQWQVTLGNSEEWVDAGPVRQLFRKVTFPLLLPTYLGQRLTIPFASSAGYSREWLISSLLCFPLALIAYLGLVSLPGVLTACGVGICAAILGAVLTAWDEPGQMAVQGLGGRAAAVVPGVLAVLAFCMGVVWIDTIATEVVGIITFLAGLASLPSGVMGLTMLAWGNSLGDFFGNRAMAKAGHTSTAITACFAAPLFNMLISLACGFSSYLHKLGTNSVKVTLTPEVALGCLFLIGYNIAIIGVGKLCGWRLPPWFRHFARAWYGLYFVLAVASGFYQQQ